jgi:hypothetical protein
VVRSDNRIEFAAHGTDENSIGGKGSGDLRIPGRRSEQLCVLVPKSSSVTGVWIERTQRDARLGDAEPVSQTVASNQGGIHDRLAGQGARHLA